MHIQNEKAQTITIRTDSTKRKKRESMHVQITSKIWPAYIYMKRGKSQEKFASKFKHDLYCCTFLFFFLIKRLPRKPHLSPLQHETDPPLFSLLLYRTFLTKEHTSKYSSQGQLPFSSMLKHISQAFSTIEKDTTKSLGLRGIRVLEPTPLLQSKCEWWNKMAANFEDKKIIKKSLLVGIKKIFPET